jgi:uncharacterized membrane-anchored protein
MTRSNVRLGLLLAVALQFVVLVGMVAKAAMPLWTGTEVHVKTIPVDPRSLFRGNYARLQYGFSRLPQGELAKAENLRIGEIVYVTLEPGDNGLYEFAAASFDKPRAGIFLRGRVMNRYQPFRVKYGIEAYFAPKEKALKLERELRVGGVAILMIDSNGRVTLKDVVAGETK